MRVPEKRRHLGWMGAAAALWAAPVFAQPFEVVYGGPASHEQAGKRAAAVRACPGGGFVAVGSTTAPASPQNVYLVRTAADGRRMWENVYDVGPNGDDRGQAVAEAQDGSGFIIAGATYLNAATGDDLLLMKVRCDGTPVWAFAYQSAGAGTETALDLVEAQSGNPILGTRPGDLLVAGAAKSAAGNTDAVLLRARANGTPVWNRRYDFGGAIRGLTEARPIPPNATGDVVGAGVLVLATGNAQGYALRVNGNTGLIAAAPQGAAIFGGGAGQEWFESVVELRVPPLARALVFAGTARSAAGAGDLYLIDTDGMGHTSCDLAWDPPHVESPFPVERINPVATAFLQPAARLVRVTRMDTGYQNCP